VHRSSTTQSGVSRHKSRPVKWKPKISQLYCVVCGRIQTVLCAIKQTQGTVRHVRRDISRCLHDRLHMDRKVSHIVVNFALDWWEFIYECIIQNNGLSDYVLLQDISWRMCSFSFCTVWHVLQYAVLVEMIDECLAVVYCCRELNVNSLCWRWTWFELICSGAWCSCDNRKMP